MKNNKRIMAVIVAIVLAISSVFIYKVAIAPKLYDNYLNTGIKYLTDGQYEEAILSFDKAIKIEKKTTEARVYKAKAHIGNDEFDKAIVVLKEAQNIDITNEELLKEIIDVVDDVDTDIAYDFLDRFIEAVGENNISNEIKDLADSAYETPSEVTANPTPGTYIDAINVSLKLDKSKLGHGYYYTVDGSDPNKESTKYNGNIEVNKNTIVKVIGYNRKDESTDIVTLEYIIDKEILGEVKNTITESETLSTDTKVGSKVGNVSKSDKDKLDAVIVKAKKLTEKESLRYNEVVEIKNDLENAIEKFKNSIIKPTDKSKLKSAISDAKSLYNNSSEGTTDGKYKSGSRKTLLAAINKSQKVYDDSTSRQNAIDSQTSSLKSAIAKFKDSKVKDLSSLRNKYINSIKSLEREQEQLYQNWEMHSNASTGAELDKIYNKYEVVLKEMNSELERELPQSKIPKLNELKNKWVRDKKKIKKELDELMQINPGTWATQEYPERYIEGINKHCYNVINTFMK